MNESARKWVLLGLLPGAALGGIGTFAALQWGGEETRTLVIIQAPGGDGREPTKAEIAAFEAEWDRCLASGYNCALNMGELPATPGRTGWLTPIPGE